MAKVIVKLNRKSTKDVKKKIRFFYIEWFFNKWMSKYLFPELNYQQKNFIMRKWWGDGSVACSAISSADNILAGLMKDGEIDMGSNKLIFTPWAPAKRYNIYDYCTHVRLINTRGVKFITQEELEIDKEVVIIYAQKNHKSVYSSIEAKVEEIIDLEMKKRVALKAQSQPWMYTFSPEDRENAKILQEQMEEDEPYLFAPFNAPDKVKGITSGAPYIVDKIQQQIDGRVNEVLTILGVQNLGIDEKKEHLIVDEVNANNENVAQQSVAFKNEIEDGFDRVETCFNFKVHVVDMNDQISQDPENGQSQQEEDYDNGENN